GTSSRADVCPSSAQVMCVTDRKAVTTLARAATGMLLVGRSNACSAYPGQEPPLMAERALAIGAQNATGTNQFADHLQRVEEVDGEVRSHALLASDAVRGGPKESIGRGGRLGQHDACRILRR